MNELARYLLRHAYIDFEGAVTIDDVRKFLREEDSAASRALLGKLIEDKGVDDLMLTLADCLREHITSGINATVVREQLVNYSES